ncbi:hypothetical protein EAI26_04685, partial [Lactobacillus sp. 0.1XD8-4]|nr:hypothetical protein [Lactobacillus sp. 0.1XD8-4]
RGQQMSSFLYKKSGMEFSSIPESVYPLFKVLTTIFVLKKPKEKGGFIYLSFECLIIIIRHLFYI